MTLNEERGLAQLDGASAPDPQMFGKRGLGEDWNESGSPFAGIESGIEPMTFGQFLDEPHVSELFRDEGYLFAHTALSPLGELATEFSDVEEIAKGAVNRLAMSYLWGRPIDDIDDTYEASAAGFSLSEFGRVPADDKDLYQMIQGRVMELEAVRPSPVPTPGPRPASVSVSAPGPVPGPVPTPTPLPPPEKIDVSQMDQAERDAIFSQQYPGLGPTLKVIHGAVSFLEPFVQSNDDLAITTEEEYRETQKKLGQLAQLSPASFNPAGAIAQDDGQGHLVPNWEGLGSLGGGLVTGRMGVVFQGKRYLDLPSLKASVRNVLAPPPVETRITSNWDPDTKAYYDHDGSRLTDREASLFRAKQVPWMGPPEAPMPTNPYRSKNGRLKVNSTIDKKTDPASYKAERKLKDILANQAESDRIYNSLPESKGGKVLNPDIFREIDPNYRTKEGRVENTIATGATASAAFRDRLWREISNPNGRRKLVFTAGGPGAGKSIAVDEALAANADLIVDSTLRDTRWARETIELALKNNWEIRVRYIQRPIEDVTIGVILRADESGRWFPIRELAKAHIDAQQSVLNLSKAFSGNLNIRFRYTYKEGEKARQLSLSDIDENGSWNYRYENERSGTEGMGRRAGQGGSIGIGQSALRRGSEEAFRRVVRGKRVERKLLEKLARGDEGFQRLIEEIYGPKE